MQEEAIVRYGGGLGYEGKDEMKNNGFVIRFGNRIDRT